MKLPISTLDILTQLAEFDVWLTPSLGEIRVYGMKPEDLVAQAIEIAPGAAKNLSNSTVLLSDMRWLSEQRWIMTR